MEKRLYKSNENKMLDGVFGRQWYHCVYHSGNHYSNSLQ